MRSKDAYSKKITSEEEENGYFLVLKDRLSFFPQMSKPFRIVYNGQSRKVRVESYPCQCRGPDEPHSHYFVRSRGLRTGDRLVVRRDSPGGKKYLLHVQRPPRKT